MLLVRRVDHGWHHRRQPPVFNRFDYLNFWRCVPNRHGLPHPLSRYALLQRLLKDQVGKRELAHLFFRVGGHEGLSVGLTFRRHWHRQSLLTDFEVKCADVGATFLNVQLFVHVEAFKLGDGGQKELTCFKISVMVHFCN